MLHLDCTILSAVVDQAMTAAAGHPRWLNAINRAVIEVLSNPYMHRDTDHGGLILVSSSSGNLYTSNGTCQCEAFKFNRPCWHRAAARLVRRHDEEQAKATDRAAIIARQRAAEAALLECFA
jgi:hypothetical protein